MLPHNLEILVALLDTRSEVDVAYGWYYWMDKNGRPNSWQSPQIIGEIPPQRDIPWPDVALRPNGPTLQGRILPQLVLEETFMMGSTLIRRECVEAIGGFNEDIQFQGHWDFHLRLARAGYFFACSKQAVALWRLHSGNRGLDKDGMLGHRVALLDRLFNDPKLETTLAGVRKQAYYNAYMEATLDYCGLGHFNKGAECLHEALRHLPQRFDDWNDLTTNCVDGLFNLRMQARRSSDDLINRIAQIALKVEGDSPVRFVHELFRSIQPMPQVNRLRRRALGRVNADLAFSYYQAGTFGRAWRHALSAVIHDRSWLHNRSLARTGLDSLLGPNLVDWIRSSRIFITNYRLEKIAKTPCLFISPHFDDIALSCGGTLAHLAQRKADILLVTVFTADLPTGMQIPSLAMELHKQWGGDNAPFKLRSLEEQSVAKHLGAKYHWLDFLDGMYRYQDMKDWQEQFNPDFQPKSDPCFEPVRKALLQIIQEHPGATVFAPLGLGHHRDHLIVHQAVNSIRAMTSTTTTYFYYEDYPYAAKADLQARLAQLEWATRSLTIEIGATLPERVRLIEMYTSQVEMLFGEARNIYTRVHDYATHVGTKGYPRERFWFPVSSKLLNKVQ